MYLFWLLQNGNDKLNIISTYSLSCLPLPSLLSIALPLLLISLSSMSRAGIQVYRAPPSFSFLSELLVLYRWYRSRSINPLSYARKGKLTHTRNITAMEDAMKALLEDQRRWLRQQIKEQKASIAANHQQMLEQQQHLIHQQSQLLTTQILAQLE